MTGTQKQEPVNIFQEIATRVHTIRIVKVLDVQVTTDTIGEEMDPETDPSKWVLA
jgi:hypothetical protein